MTEFQKCWETRHNLQLLTESLPELNLILRETKRGTVLLNGSVPIDRQSPTLLLDLDDLVCAYNQARHDRDHQLENFFPENSRPLLKDCDRLSRYPRAGENVYSVLAHIVLLSGLLDNPQVDLEKTAGEILAKDIENHPGRFVGSVDPQIAQIFRQTIYRPPVYKDIPGLIHWLESKKERKEKVPNVLFFTYGEEEFQALKCLNISCWGKDSLSPAISGFLFPRQDKGDFMQFIVNQKILPEGRYILIDDSKRHVDNFDKQDPRWKAYQVLRPGTKSYEEDRQNPDCLIFPGETIDNNQFDIFESSANLPNYWEQFLNSEVQP